MIIKVDKTNYINTRKALPCDTTKFKAEYGTCDFEKQMKRDASSLLKDRENQIEAKKIKTGFSVGKFKQTRWRAQEERRNKKSQFIIGRSEFN